MILDEEKTWSHEPVLLKATMDRLLTRRDGLYVDATLGLGGHAEALLKHLSERGKVLGIDVDPAAIERARKRLAFYGERFQTAEGDYKGIASLIEPLNFYPLSGALFDLGVSSMQLDNPDRGFSFLRDGPLDMRMGPSRTLTAEQIVNLWPQEQLLMLLQDFGEEAAAEKIAAAIVARRARAPIKRTTELAEVVASVVPRTGGHPATKTFQALRIAVNGELDSISPALTAAASYLEKGGALCAISFHSGEDRIVKNVFSSLVAEGKCVYFGDDSRHAQTAGDEEVARNPRARSAKLRAVKKV